MTHSRGRTAFAISVPLILLGLLAALTTSVSSAAFVGVTNTDANVVAGSLSGPNAPRSGVPFFVANPRPSGCLASWSNLAGGTAVADRYEMFREPSGASLITTTPGDVTVGSYNDTAAPTVSSYRLITRASSNWVSAPSESSVTTCINQGQLSVDAGEVSTCGIQTSGLLWCWGFGQGQATADANMLTTSSPVQAGSALWRQVSVGQWHACGIQTDGTLWCWGDNWIGQLGIGSTTDSVNPVQVGTATDWTTVRAFGDTTCALRGSGSLFCWGSNAQGQVGNGTNVAPLSPVQIGTAINWTAISGHRNFTCAVNRSNNMFCWGTNTDGQLGDGTFTNRLVPTQVVGGGSYAPSLATGHTQTCAVQIDSTLWCWGSNWKGEGGTPPRGLINSPAQVGTDTDWAQVVASRRFTCATKVDRTLWCAGSNIDGRTGLGSTTGDTFGFTQVGTDSDWAMITAGNKWACGVKLDTSLWCWGTNGVGQAGQVNTVWQSPVSVDGANNWLRARVGYRQSCGLKSDLSLWCWGSNDNAQLGVGNYDDGYFEPTELSPGTTWNDIAAGDFSTCALRSDQTIWCWGANQYGQLGIGGFASQTSPVQTGTDTDWAVIGNGRDHVCGIKLSGSLWCWGNNAQGKLGDGTTTVRTAPTQIGAATNWRSVDGGFSHTCAVRTDGTLWCWGHGGFGKIGDGTGTNRSTPTQVGTDTNWDSVGLGRDHTCAVKTTGELWCWGFNIGGQLGDGTTTNRTSPVQIGASNAWVQVDGGENFSCGLRNDDNLWCWGRNSAGQFGNGTVGGVSVNPAPMYGSVADFSVSSGRWHVCAITTSAENFCWGANDSGQLGYEVSIPTPQQVAGGYAWNP